MSLNHAQAFVSDRDRELRHKTKEEEGKHSIITWQVALTHDVKTMVAEKASFKHTYTSAWLTTLFSFIDPAITLG